MGKLCNFINCQRLGSSTFHGYCNEGHYKSAQKMAEKEGTILLDFDWVDRAVALMRESDKVNKEIERQIDTEWLVEANAMLEKIKKETEGESHNQHNSESQQK